jgi:hypothetical protein
MVDNLPQAKEGADDVPSSALRAVHTALDLWRMVGLVTSEEFHREEDRYDGDSRQGCELLFLIANYEWVRGTSEIVNIGRSDAIETALKIDIDLGQITHESFRGKSGLIWLPVTVLPLQNVNGRHEPDPFATVTDAAGNLLPLMPADDLGYRMSAGLAEIIINMAIAHQPRRRSEGSPRVPTHDEYVLLCAAVRRLLRRESQPAPGPASTAVLAEFDEFVAGLAQILAAPGSDPARFRINDAEHRLRELLAIYIVYLGQYAKIPAAATAVSEWGLGESQFAPRLAYRAVRVLQALAASTIITVPLKVDTAPTVLTVRVPMRNLKPTTRQARLTRPGTWKPNPGTWNIRPSAHLEIDVLLPTADADRQLQVHLADGLSFEDSANAGRPDGGVTAPRLDIAVMNPPPVLDLSVSMEEVLRVSDLSGLRPLAPSLVDLAQARAALVAHALRHYEVRAQDDAPSSSSDDRPTPTDQSLADLREKLPSVTDDAASVVRLRAFWQQSRLDRLNLFRRTSVDPLGPRALVARMEVIDDVAQRATPEKAVISADVRMADSEYFSITRTSAWLSLIVMIGILISLIGWHLISPASSAHPEVLAIVLTLFAAIQASRIERPDRSTLQGQLSGGTGMLAGAMLPPVVLAIALAFQPAVLAGSIWATACIACQLLFLGLMGWWWGPLEAGRQPRSRSRAWCTIGDRRRFETDHLDYGHFEVLRSDYWRNTTADALLVGRRAYGYAIWQETAQDEPVPPRLEPLLAPVGRPASPGEEPEDLLALLHSSTHQQAITFVVLREKRDDLLPAGPDQPVIRPGLCIREAVPFELDPDRMAPRDNVASYVDIFVGQHGDFPALGNHPLITALEAARGRLIVLEAQLPFPAPLPGYPGRQWARLRMALRDAEDIRRLTEFLNDIYVKIVRRKDAAHVVVVQADPTLDPRDIGRSGTSWSGHQRTRPGEDAGDLYLPAGSIIQGEDPAAKTWRMMASCVPARSNIESDIIAQLAPYKSRFQLAHLNFALLHGMAMVIMLLHATGGPPEQDQDPDATSCGQPGILVNAPVSADDLGPLDECPLVHIRFRSQDRPGAFLGVLNSIDATLAGPPLAIARPGRSVSFARMSIATGRMADGDLTIRVHDPAQVDGHGNQLMTEQLARKISAGAAPDGRRNPVIRVDLLGRG